MAARTKNFSQHETDELLRLAKKYKNDVECPKADKISTHRKDLAWEKIEEEFNKQANCVVYRDRGTLRTKYRNLKKILRRLDPDSFVGSRRRGATKRRREPSSEEDVDDLLPDIELDRSSASGSDKIIQKDDIASAEAEWIEKKCRKEIQIMEIEHAKRMEVMHTEHIKRLQIMGLELEKLKLEKDLLKRQLEG